MAIIKLTCDSGANIRSCRESEWLDTVKDLDMEEGEWENYTEDEKYKYVEEWAWQNGLAIYFEEK